MNSIWPLSPLFRKKKKNAQGDLKSSRNKYCLVGFTMFVFKKDLKYEIWRKMKYDIEGSFSNNDLALF